MPEVRTKKGKNFKEIIEEEKNKGKTTKKIMHALTSINQEVVYGGSFLFLFVIITVTIYSAFAPDVYVWAGLLIVAAVISSLFASRVSSALKRNQWKYNS
ncbi:MAG: hypothetical protein NWE92_03610 [Candidatus Bathyarchaeota archaeon]|nr:hypothetical protein [Candidatus Bathyarchaeota archaeon]